MVKLSKVSCTYGAPMGRASGSERTPTDLVTVSKVVLDSGGYDRGGAYWGTPDDLYMAEDGQGFQEFIRSTGRLGAQEHFQAQFPEAEFTREPDYDAFLAGYLACAAWCGVEEQEPTGRDFTEGEFTRAAVRRAIDECNAFVDANWSDLQAFDESDMGHNLWLTRNHHGTGFWDRDEIPEDVGKRLTAASHAAGEQGVWVSKRKRLNFDY